MSDENQEVEQITTPPALAAPKPRKESKPKDPKKVAAGKRLAEHNRRAREALKNEEKREEMERTAGERSSDAWIPEISFTTALSVVGVVLALLDLLTRYRANAATGKTGASHIEASHAERSPAEGSPTEGPVHLKTVQPPKFGMD